MHTLIDLTNQLNDYLQIALFSDFCPNGLQIEGCAKPKRIATAVSASLHIIQEAIKHQAEALIVHHGLFWKGDSYIVEGIKREKIHKLLSHDISLLAYHLPLDAHHEIGNNWKAAHDLNFSGLEPFYQVDKQWIGVKGKVEKMPRSELVNRLEAYYGQKAVLALGGKDLIETVALISGGAYRQLEHAAKEGIDFYVTGNFDEPAWHVAHERKINFAALGHAATEKVGPRALADYLRRIDSIDAFFLDEINPF
jgi:dinuclear metal center YbgI/SA1388 family protein